MSGVFSIADEFVDRLAAYDPIAATFIGIAGHDDRMTDYSPSTSEEMAGIQRGTLSAMSAARPDGERERACRETFIEEMESDLALHDAGEHLRGLNILHSPVQGIRMVFDMMPRASEENWRNIATRLAAVPQALSSYRETLRKGAACGLTASRRQTVGCAEQAEAWSGGGDGKSFFDGLLDSFDQSAVDSASIRSDLARGAAEAGRAYSELARYLREEYMPSAVREDGVGHDRYALHARSFNGVELDLDDTYRWGWDQLAWVRSEMEKTAGRIKPASSVDEAIQLLESDPARSIEGEERFRRWMQDLQDGTIAQLDGVHFDLADPVKRIEALIAPPGGALAMYYTGPSEDFSRPGRTWYPTGGKTRFPLWREVSIAYHEGVPGHHFQIATTKSLAGELSRYQRLIAGTSGYVEGWALYAERLMGELGYLENPDYYMGMLDAQALRSVRVIIDIGMHLGMDIPQGADFHPGETWSPDLGNEMMSRYAHFPTDFTASEIDRYLGLPGQAISYKVGEREWLEARQYARERLGGSFDLRDWHNKALRLGPMGLDQMRREMSVV